MEKMNKLKKYITPSTLVLPIVFDVMAKNVSQQFTDDSDPSTTGGDAKEYIMLLPTEELDNNIWQ